MAATAKAHKADTAVSVSYLPENDLEHAFETCLVPLNTTERNLAGAVVHALQNRGSMMRARIAQLLARNFCLGDQAALNLAISVELFHTASLLFDDLPCMDDATERRGVPCTHKVFGESAATLAALALINKAYNLLWSAMQSVPSKNRDAGAAFVERCLGVGGILNGQSYDLQFSSAPRSGNRVMRVAIGKTVSLIRMTLVLPAILGGASPQQIRVLNRLSVFWGLAYQVMDDLKDVLRTASEARKTTHRDAVLGRPNLALAEGPIRTSRLLARLIFLGDETLAEAETSLVEPLRHLQRKVAAEFLGLQREASAQ